MKDVIKELTGCTSFKDRNKEVTHHSSVRQKGLGSWRVSGKDEVKEGMGT